jgi:AraC-like DNA-binding protein
MIKFGPMSTVLLVGALQGLAIAALLLQDSANRVANRYLALLIIAFVSLVTPYIIGYAGFYERWPQLSFAPFSYTTAFGPLMWLYTRALVGDPPQPIWPHFAPVALQFLSQAVVFPLPLATKDWWDSVAHAPFVSPAFELAALVSLAIYGRSALRDYRYYCAWLLNNRADAMDFDPRWIRNFLISILGVSLIWAGFVIANWLDSSRNYFDQFWLYVVFSILVISLGIEGWRHADLRFPRKSDEAVQPDPPDRDWHALAGQWLEVLDREEYWRDPDITLALLSRKLGINTAYLSRALNLGLGQNFNAVINQRRVAAVQRLLSDPEETRDLLTIALEVGFGSKASFNRAFSKFSGKSPTSWRLKSGK